jgi:tRNA pseudouridine38-40 synthase
MKAALMPRYKMLIEYDGTNYCGWQSQPDEPTIQGAIEKAFERFTGNNISVQGGGRTDAGVHALGQVAHVDLDHPCDPFVIQQAINHYLKKDSISILSTQAVEDSFHARFSATYRTYRYIIINRYAPLALEENRAWLVRGTPLNIDLMREGAKALLGTHDFSAFRAAGCQAASPIKTLDVLDIASKGDRLTIFVKARSFLHHQVRNMVGTLKLVGMGKITPDHVTSILLSQDRTKAGPTAPAGGLYFLSIGYD